MTKTCPIFSEYNGYWYFYEDIGQLAPKWLLSKATGQPEQRPSQTPVVSEQSKGQAFNELYVNMKGRLEQAYTLNQQMQNFSWYPLEELSWLSKDEKGNDRIIVMADILPSKKALQPLLMQSDRCNAFAVKLWLENPYKKPTDQNGKHLTPTEWHALSQQLEIEIDKAENQANKIKLDTSNKFADIDRELDIHPFAKDFQDKHANYTALLDDIMKNLEQSRLLALEIRHLDINPYALNVP